MTSHASSYRRGLAVAAVVCSALASPARNLLPSRASATPVTTSAATVSARRVAQRSSTPNGAIMVADNTGQRQRQLERQRKAKATATTETANGGNWNGNKNGNWNGNKSGNWNGNKSGNWNGNKSGNWNGNKNGNWNKGGNYGNNWNKGGDKHWSNNNHWNNNWNKGWNNRAYVRGWSNRPYYGEFFGGVVLGSLLAAAGAGVVPYSPDPELCWYWADPYMYRGYWDYCY